jgi:Fe-S cluster assembly iron-binding protein IscA
MFHVTEKAIDQIREYFDGKDIVPIRIYYHSGCGGPKVAMTLDVERDMDDVFTFEGFDFVINRDFFEYAKPVTVDYLETGFEVTSNIEIDEEAAGCSSCGSEGSCCSA